MSNIFIFVCTKTLNVIIFLRVRRMLTRGFNFFWGGGEKNCQVARMLLSAVGERQALLQFFLLQMCLPLCVGMLCPSQPMFYVMLLSVVF